MQWLSDHSVHIILTLATIHVLGFLWLFRARNVMRRQLKLELHNTVKNLPSCPDEPLQVDVDDQIDRFITVIREVVQDPARPDERRQIHNELRVRSKALRSVRSSFWETLHNLGRNFIEAYPLMGILGTILAIGLGISSPADASPDPGPAEPTTLPVVQNASEIFVVAAPPQSESAVATIVGNFKNAIWSTFWGIAAAIVLIFMNALLEPGFGRLIEHQRAVREIMRMATREASVQPQHGEPAS
jgi:biopolymer transport protein ExbB